MCFDCLIVTNGMRAFLSICHRFDRSEYVCPVKDTNFNTENDVYKLIKSEAMTHIKAYDRKTR